MFKQISQKFTQKKDYHQKDMALNLHLHNAKPRMQDINLNYVQEEKSKVMVHPSYPPGLSSLGVWLFS